MHFYIEQTKIPLYGLMLILSFVLMALFIGISLYKLKVPGILIGYSLLLTTFCVVSGAVIFHIVTHLNQGMSLSNLGISSYGGAIGLISSTFIFTAIYKEKRQQIITLYFLTLPLMYGISKLGCFLGGCCYGIPYNQIGYVHYNIYNTPTEPLFPVQLAETICFLIIFGFCCYLFFYKKNKYLIEFIMIFCALGKFVLDFLRSSHINIILSVNQVVSLIFIAIAVFCILFRKYRTAKE